VYYMSLMKSCKDQAENGTTSTSDTPFKQVPTTFGSHAVLNPPPYGLFNGTAYSLGLARTKVPGRLGAISGNPGLVSQMPVVAEGTASQFAFYHSGTLSGFYTSTILLPETESCVIVLVNTKPLCDSADWIAQAYLETLLDPLEKNDYIKLTEESVKNQKRRYPEALETLEKARVTGTIPKPAE
jgi:hypothetical protein